MDTTVILFLKLFSNYKSAFRRDYWERNHQEEFGLFDGAADLAIGAGVVKRTKNGSLVLTKSGREILNMPHGSEAAAYRSLHSNRIS